MLGELAPQVRSGGHRLPCAALRALATRPRRPSTWKSHLSERALILAAYQVRFAELLADCLPPGEVPVDDVALACRPRLLPIQLGQIRWEDLSSRQVLGRGLVVADPAVHFFLRKIPVSLVTQCLEWAPPVIAPPAADGSCRIVANIVPALMAWHRCPDLEVRAAQVIGHRPPSRPLPDIVRAVLHYFGPLVEEHAGEIARFAPSLELAPLLSGLSRATCARRRPGVRETPPAAAAQPAPPPADSAEAEA